MAELGRGEAAPDFDLFDQNGENVKLSDYSGKKVLVYFYPRADTPGCTKQACSVRDNMATLKSLGITVLGISPDTPSKQKKFDEKYGLGFPLLSDPDHKAAEAYGVWGEKSMYGKKLFGIVRSSFLIDGDGTVIDRWYKVKPLDTVEKATAALIR
jgi:peroxiredoxin Q/BCP